MEGTTGHQSADERAIYWRQVQFSLCVMAALSVALGPVSAQTFDSGSDGSDGALTIPSSSGTIVFDPADVARWGKVLDADGDGVYNFTTIVVGAGSTLKFPGDRIRRPLHWVASGDVVVDGVLDLSGSNGTATSNLAARRLIAMPGPGGYAGGAGGLFGTTVPNTPGEGPGAGSGTWDCAGRIGSNCGNGARFSGNRYSLPLVGGSGGAGAFYDTGRYFGGGAGGGAIVLASSTNIMVRGGILAAGGDGADAGGGGGGSGGAIRLVAPMLSGNGMLNVRGGIGSNGGLVMLRADSGIVRLEGSQPVGAFTFPAGAQYVTRGLPSDSSTLRPSSTLRVVTIDGVPVSSNPSGGFALPDVEIRNGGIVNVVIEASGIPPGTLVNFQVYPEIPVVETVVNLPAVQATLAGTLQASSATLAFTFPYGFSRGFVRATWSQ